MEAEDGSASKLEIGQWSYEDGSVFFDFYTEAGSNQEVECDTMCEGTEYLDEWDISYMIDIEEQLAELTYHSRALPDVRMEQSIDFGAQVWNRTLYVDEEPVFNKTWNFEPLGASGGNMTFEYTMEAATSDSFYVFEDELEMHPGYENFTTYVEKDGGWHSRAEITFVSSGEEYGQHIRLSYALR